LKLFKIYGYDCKRDKRSRIVSEVFSNINKQFKIQNTLNYFYQHLF